MNILKIIFSPNKYLIKKKIYIYLNFSNPTIIAYLINIYILFFFSKSIGIFLRLGSMPTLAAGHCTRLASQKLLCVWQRLWWWCRFQHFSNLPLVLTNYSMNVKTKIISMLLMPIFSKIFEVVSNKRRRTIFLY